MDRGAPRLVQHFSVFDAWRVSQLPPHLPGSPTFHFMSQMAANPKPGLGMAYQMIQAQSWLLAYNDVYRLLAIIALCCVPWCMLLRRPGGKSAVSME
jgi:hypothetical protein